MKINPSELYVVPDTLSWAELSAKLGNKTFTSQGAEQYGSYGGGGGGATRGRGGFGGSGNRGGGDIGRGSGYVFWFPFSSFFMPCAMIDGGASH